MPLLWNQPKLSWGIEIGTDQIHVVGLRDTSPWPELCHEFSIAAPNTLQLPAHLNNPIALGKHLAEVLRERGVQQGGCCFALPEVQQAILPLDQSIPKRSLPQSVARFVESQVAEPSQHWAIDFVTTGDHCAVAYCPKSLVNDYLLLASYTPLATTALEPEGVAVERALRVLRPECVRAPTLLAVLTPSGCLWQAYQAQALLHQRFMTWSLTPEALPYAGWAPFRVDLSRGFKQLQAAQGQLTGFGLLLAGAWAAEPELQAELTALHAPPSVVGDPRSASSQPAATYLVAYGLALRACRHASV